MLDYLIVGGVMFTGMVAAIVSAGRSARRRRGVGKLSPAATASLIVAPNIAPLIMVQQAPVGRSNPEAS